MKVNYSAASRRGKSTGVLVTVEPAGNWPQVATFEIGWLPIAPSFSFAPSDCQRISQVAGITGFNRTASARKASEVL
jgi:hypothetical protein